VFGRQPQKVTVRLDGEPEDVQRWARILARHAEQHGDDVQRNIVGDGSIFVIHPRAVND
jgi:hypothetical protein